MPTRQIGPFDPLRPNTSFLPDGALDAGDANMPALRVDLDTTGTIGPLIKADKSDVYSLSGNGASDGAVAHNLYAPFYKAYIPAANRSGTSGVAGTFGNNFPGFVTEGHSRTTTGIRSSRRSTATRTTRAATRSARSTRARVASVA